MIGNTEDFQDAQVAAPRTLSLFDHTNANSMGSASTVLSDVTNSGHQKKPMPTRNYLKQNRLLNNASQQTKQLLSTPIGEEPVSDDENRMKI